MLILRRYEATLGSSLPRVAICGLKNSTVLKLSIQVASDMKSLVAAMFLGRVYRLGEPKIAPEHQLRQPQSVMPTRRGSRLMMRKFKPLPCQRKGTILIGDSRVEARWLLGLRNDIFPSRVLLLDHCSNMRVDMAARLVVNQTRRTDHLRKKHSQSSISVGLARPS